MRETQMDAMQDMGIIQDYTPSEVSGEHQPSWIERSEPTILGLKMRTETMRQGGETHGMEMDIVETHGQVRLPLGVLIEAEDRIRIFSRFGQGISDLIVACASTPKEGPSGITIDFRIVEPGANR